MLYMALLYNYIQCYIYQCYHAAVAAVIYSITMYVYIPMLETTPHKLKARCDIPKSNKFHDIMKIAHT